MNEIEFFLNPVSKVTKLWHLPWKQVFLFFQTCRLRPYQVLSPRSTAHLRGAQSWQRRNLKVAHSASRMSFSWILGLWVTIVTWCPTLCVAVSYMKRNMTVGARQTRQRVVAAAATAVVRNVLGNDGSTFVATVSPDPLMCCSRVPPQVAGQSTGRSLICFLS